MRYIKLFESLDKYTKISNTEYDDLCGNLLDISIVDNLSSLGYGVKLVHVNNTIRKRQEKFIRVFSLHNVSALISEIEDEWYLVRISWTQYSPRPTKSLFTLNAERTSHNRFMYFKCDQFDGLIDCLKGNME